MSLKRLLLAPIRDVNLKSSSAGESYLELDGLRGIAVLIVIMSHTSAFGMYGQGSLGVLLFFFLSGFVLALPYVDSPAKMRGFKPISGFAVNRALRIVPAYWVACVLIYFWASSPIDWLLWNMSFVKGWNHFWSVAEEVRFYLLFPMVILLLSFLKSPVTRALALMGMILFFYEFKSAHKIDMMTAGKRVDFYFWMFLGGVLVCLLQQGCRTFVEKNSWVKRVLALLGFAVLLSLIGSSTYMIDHLWRPMFPSLPAGTKLNGWSIPHVWFFMLLTLFLACTVVRDSCLNRFLRLWIFRHIGLLSYSIYIIHMTVQFTLMNHGFRSEKLFFAVLVVAYLYAYFSYILVEKPSLNFKRMSRR